MKISKYWARETASATARDGQRYRLVSWSGSDRDPGEAKTLALAKLEGWKKLLREGRPLDDYPYQDKDQLKEELIEEHRDEAGELIAAITRNRYGALVLNSAKVLFADVDLPTPLGPRAGLLGRLLQRLRGAPRPQDEAARLRETYRQRFVEFQRRHPRLQLRVYETRAGFRLAVGNRLFEPTGEQTRELLRELDSDELYIRLCRSQQCFRARLTPKPWRCGHKGPPNPFPREDAEQAARFARWLQSYRDKAAGYRVCRLSQELGDGPALAAAEPVLRLHDTYVLGPDDGVERALA